METLRSDLNAKQAASPGSWTREESVWTDNLGYPGAVTLYQQRLVLAGSPKYPQTILWSETGAYLSFELGTKDDAAISFTVSSDQLNPIVHLAQMNTLIALTYGGEFTITSGNDAAITPTNISVKNPSPYGCNSIRPLRVGTEILFIQRAVRQALCRGVRSRQLRVLCCERFDGTGGAHHGGRRARYGLPAAAGRAYLAGA
ncbi:MAG: hypothetical protein ACMX3H_17095 [Sodalis sp. (in: enterobacteria)]|uniref:hypothetical protein n=1 Tax=Sodalis sp. (in: enterobacteria) TaxID=1898979 RepID=UPI0039E4FB80